MSTRLRTASHFIQLFLGRRRVINKIHILTREEEGGRASVAKHTLAITNRALGDSFLSSSPIVRRGGLHKSEKKPLTVHRTLFSGEPVT